MSVLYIYDGDKMRGSVPNKSDFIYYLSDNIVDTEATCLNDPQKIDQIALEKSHEYVAYINSLNKYFINNKLIYENTISSFFFSDLFNKRSEIFDTYISICHLVLLKNIKINELSINKIVTISCSKMFVQSLQSVFLDCNIIEFNSQAENFSRINFKYKQLKYFSKFFVQLFIIKIFYKKKYNNKKIENIFLTRYPLHLDNSFNEEKYGKMVKKNDWYLISMLTDGMHQSIDITDTPLFTNKLNQNNNSILLDYFVSIKDIISAICQNLVSSINFKKLIYRQKYSFQGINISKFIVSEIEQSFLRLPRLFLYRNALIKVFSKYHIDNFIFYLHEYSYGRYINYILSNYFPHVKRIGFQHGPASRRKLLYQLGEGITSNNIKDWKYKTPIPNSILAEDQLSKQIYLDAGYKNVNIMDEVFRLEYLKKINRNNKTDNMILIVPGLHDGLLLINKIKDLIKNKPDKLFVLKPHPRSTHFKNNIPSKFDYNNLKLGRDHISKYLEKASEVIVTYSSVGTEAYKIGIPVTLVSVANKINESPLLDYDLNDNNNMITFL